MNLEAYIRDIPDFPKPGIIFKDISPLLEHPKTLKETADELQQRVQHLQVDKIVGIESRGFIFGPMLAERLDAGFVPVRKKGKLPYKTIEIAYDLEYGSDVLEMHIDAIKPGEHILIHDDILATGGTASAVEKLVKQAGGVVVGCNFVIKLAFLEGQKRLTSPVTSLLQY